MSVGRRNQRPLEEYRQTLWRLVFSTLAGSQAPGLIRPLALVGLDQPAALSVELPSGAGPASNNLSPLVLVLAVFAVLPAVFCCLRQWLGWSPTCHRPPAI